MNRKTIGFLFSFAEYLAACARMKARRPSVALAKEVEELRRISQRYLGALL